VGLWDQPGGAVERKQKKGRRKRRRPDAVAAAEAVRAAGIWSGSRPAAPACAYDDERFPDGVEGGPRPDHLQVIGRPPPPPLPVVLHVPRWLTTAAWLGCVPPCVQEQLVGDAAVDGEDGGHHRYRHDVAPPWLGPGDSATATAGQPQPQPQQPQQQRRRRQHEGEGAEPGRARVDQVLRPRGGNFIAAGGGGARKKKKGPRGTGCGGGGGGGQRTLDDVLLRRNTSTAAATAAEGGARASEPERRRRQQQPAVLSAVPDVAQLHQQFLSARQPQAAMATVTNMGAGTQIDGSGTSYRHPWQARAAQRTVSKPVAPLN
jgi:hypothetical protein